MAFPRPDQCPRCGKYCSVYDGENGLKRVECNKCNYEGPSEKTATAAIRAHNAAQRR